MRKLRKIKEFLFKGIVKITSFLVFLYLSVLLYMSLIVIVLV